jgi:acyl-CoA reductase-like NAD-dependent aldehyde dehydrogenase
VNSAETSPELARRPFRRGRDRGRRQGDRPRRPSDDPVLADGAFYRPTLLSVPGSSLPIVQQETFGPVQTIQVFDTVEDALANDTDYGVASIEDFLEYKQITQNYAPLGG